MTGPLVLATRNAHKVREFERLLPGMAIEPLPDDVVLPPETGDSYVANARIKASAAAEATGRPSFADDSGIEAAALDGAPGIFSARFAGTDATDADNLAKLRAAAPAGSGLRYVCAIVLVSPDGGEIVAQERCEGTMAPAPRGERGFGYDPVFVPADGDGARTMAELSDEEKDAISHRGRAARALAARLAGD